MPSLRAFLAAVLIAVPSVLYSLQWDAPAFSLDPKEAAQAAAAVTVKEGEDAVFLHEEDVFTFSDKGTAVSTHHALYRILSNEGVKRWSTVTAYWQPWRQDRPAMRARVISRAGVVSTLDPKTIADSTAHQIDPDLYSDSRMLNAPLPNLEAGCIVEFEIVTVDRAPILSAGSVSRVWFGHSVPVLSRRLVLDYPSALPVRYRVRGGTMSPLKDQTQGRIRNTFNAANISAIRGIEGNLPPDAVPYTCVEFSTGSSWQAVARAYSDSAELIVGKDSLKSYVDQVLGTPRPRAGTPSQRAEIIKKILYRITTDVRYTGLNFGENSIIPHPPVDTLRLGYGDCKDQASLLVAALREAGIEANLALLLAGSDPDVLPDLPGFGQFNHAIVYLPLDAIWIDPTASFYHPGEIPPMDQGRRSLVISPTTLSLMVTPESAPSANLFKEVREFHLSENGAAQVVETTSMTGSFEAFYRRDFNDSDVKSKRDHLEKYAKNVYDAKSLATFSSTDPRQMESPFRLSLTIKDSRKGWTDDSSSVVVMQAGSLLDFLPDFLTAKESPDAPFARTQDVYLQEPFVCEYDVHIVPPQGFRAAALPESKSLPFGPALFTRTFTLESDGSVSAVFRFDCVKRRFTAEEATALHTEARKFLEGEASVVTFEQVGESHLAAGRYKEALSEFQSLASLHPQEALHRIQISRTLLAAGFVRDSLKEARAAVDLEPKLARAHANLAWVLLHNEFGRIFEKGADLAQARTEYARAAALDSTVSQYTVNQAILAEYNDAFSRYGAGANLEEAVRLYRSISKDIKGTDSWNSLAIDLLRLGKFTELKEALADCANDRTRQALYLTAVTVLDGTAAAQREAVRLAASADERRNVMSLAAQFLLVARRYPEAAELMAATARGSQNAAQTIAFADKLKTVTQVSADSIGDSTPQALVLTLLASYYASSNKLSGIERWFAASVQPALATEEGRLQAGYSVLSARGGLARLQLPPEIVVDFFARFMKVDTVSEGPAVAVLVTIPDFPSFEGTVFYMKQENGAYRLVDSESYTGIAREMLWLLDRGQTADAKSWLTLLSVQNARKAGFPSLAKDDLFTLVSAREAAADDLRFAAAYILARAGEKADRELGLPIVMERWRAETAEAKKLLISTALAEALSFLEQSEDALEVSRYILKSKPDDRWGVRYASIALQRLGRAKEAEDLIRAGLAVSPDDINLQRILADHLADRGLYKEAMDVLGLLIDSGKAEPRDYNSLGWFALYLAVPDQKLLEERQLVQRLMEGSSSVLHTLVCILGDEGRTMEAQEVFGKYLDYIGDDADGATWLAFGIMAERFGLLETAADAYGRVAPEPGETYPGMSSYVLAKKHLAEMKK